MRSWDAREDGSKAPHEAFFRGAGELVFHAFSEGLGGFNKGFIVEQHEGLDGGVAAAALEDAGAAVGGIEGGEGWVVAVAFPDGVDAAAVAIFAGRGGVLGGALASGGSPDAGGLRRIDGGAAHCFGEQSTDGEGLVAKGFSVQAVAGMTPEGFVEGVFFVGVGAYAGAASISAGGDDAVEHGFGRPCVGLDEGDGQPIQKLRVGRRLALFSKLLEGWHDAATKEFGPKPVDGDAGGEGMVGVNEPAREGQPVVARGSEGLENCRDAGVDLAALQ